MDPYSGFQGHSIFQVKTDVLGTNLLKNTNRKPYRICRMVPLSRTLSASDFKVTTFLKSNIGKTAGLKDKSYYCTTGNYT